MAQSTFAPSTEKVNEDQHFPTPGQQLMGSSSRHLPRDVLKLTAKNCDREARSLRRIPGHVPQGPYSNFATEPHFSKDETPHRSWPMALMAHLLTQHQTKSTKKPRSTKVHPPIPASHLLTANTGSRRKVNRGRDPKNVRRKNSLSVALERTPRWLHPRQECLQVQCANECSPEPWFDQKGHAWEPEARNVDQSHARISNNRCLAETPAKAPNTSRFGRPLE